MPFRLLKGLLKGLIVGGLVGFALAAAGISVPSALVVYPTAAVVGVIMALISGRPIWAQGARIEVGLKAGTAALFGPAILFAVRRWLTMDVPFDVTAVPGLEAVGNNLALGTFAVTSLALVAGVLGGFFDADHQPVGKGEQAAAPKAGKQRLAVDDGLDALAEAEAAQADAVEREMRR